ncbi:hypothetical protein [Paractinoplanes toevensis]|uniref:hypothetical protein n=1 Tax=Paractinoplanes toevensis TaxID=571911 RepID=UPI001FE8B0FF|nr:hypothetical protein [Actinoplanes toevensis]
MSTFFARGIPEVSPQNETDFLSGADVGAFAGRFETGGEEGGTACGDEGGAGAIETGTGDAAVTGAAAGGGLGAHPATTSTTERSRHRIATIT